MTNKEIQEVRLAAIAYYASLNEKEAKDRLSLISDLVNEDVFYVLDMPIACLRLLTEDLQNKVIDLMKEASMLTVIGE